MRTEFFGKTRKITQLRRGDIINIDAPFEENTRDYYNGYTPQQIRGHKFTDRFGQSSKSRMVIYIGRDEQTLYYLPVTSRQTEVDLPHQYELKDNSMTPKAKNENIKSYVECDNLRTVQIPFGTDIPYTNRITNEDLKNIIHRISNLTLTFGSQRDKRGYVPHEARETFEQELSDRGFIIRKETENRKIWRKDNIEITQTKYGLIHYHVVLSKQDVAVLVSKREGRDIMREKKAKPHRRVDSVKKNHPKKKPKDDELSSSVQKLSKYRQKERGDNIDYKWDS